MAHATAILLGTQSVHIERPRAACASDEGGVRNNLQEKRVVRPNRGPQDDSSNVVCESRFAIGGLFRSTRANAATRGAAGGQPRSVSIHASCVKSLPSCRRGKPS